MQDKINTVYRGLIEHCSSDEFEYHSHVLSEIYIFHRGDCKYVIGDHIFSLQPGDMILMNGHTLHRAHPSPDEPYERSLIEFSQEWIRPMLTTLNVPELLFPFYKLNNVLFRGIDQEILEEILELIRHIDSLVSQAQIAKRYDSALNTRILESKISTMFVMILFKIHKISKSKSIQLSHSQSEKDKHIERAIIWIQQNLSSNISLDEISNNLNISKYYLSRIFKEITGFTVMQYVMNCRINRAKYLLEMFPSKTILEISENSGFDDSSHFSRFFRQQVKMTPSEYRRKNSKVI